jgi:hypothetical protein
MTNFVTPRFEASTSASASTFSATSPRLDDAGSTATNASSSIEERVRTPNPEDFLEDSMDLDALEDIPSLDASGEISFCIKKTEKDIQDLCHLLAHSAHENKKVVYKSLREKKEDLIELKSSLLAVNGNAQSHHAYISKEHFIVPTELPYIQWRTHEFRGNAHVFDTVDDALDDFESILIAHSLDPNDHWSRLLVTKFFIPQFHGW